MCQSQGSSYVLSCCWCLYILYVCLLFVFLESICLCVMSLSASVCRVCLLLVVEESVCLLVFVESVCPCSQGGYYCKPGSEQTSLFRIQWNKTAAFDPPTSLPSVRDVNIKVKRQEMSYNFHPVGGLCAEERARHIKLKGVIIRVKFYLY